jgi:SPP1 gp7 family putative phage head morphogenesis protein
MASSKYWDKRAIKRLTEAEKQSQEYIERINKMYAQAQRNIQRDIENIYQNYSKATGLDKQSLKALLTKSQSAKLWEDLKRKGLDKYVKGNYKARITRLEQIQAQIYAKAKELYPQELKAHTEHYRRVVSDTYYKSIYDAQMGTGYDFGFSTIDDNMMSALLNEKWSGKNYSQRIWGNTDLLAESLSEIVGGALTSGQSIAKTSRQIRERFEVSKYYADRLVRTETNHFNNEADAMAYEEMDVEKYVFMATLDTRTSTICQELDNSVIPLKEREVGKNFPPMHPNCRSKTRAYMGEEVEKTLKRRARDPVTGKTQVIDNMSYKEWAKQKGLELEQYGKLAQGNNANLTKKGKTGKITPEQAKAIKKEGERSRKYAKVVSYDGATDPKRLNKVNNTLEHLTNKYPTKKLNSISLQDLGDAGAQANARRLEIDRAFINGQKTPITWEEKVSNNKAKIKSLWEQWRTSTRAERVTLQDKIAKRERIIKFNRQSVSFQYGERGVITHEYGHILADQRIGLINGDSAIVPYSRAKKERYKALRDKVAKVYEQARNNGDIFNMSLYADQDYDEFFSEAFTMYEVGEKLPAYITEMITEVLNV